MFRRARRPGRNPQRLRRLDYVLGYPNNDPPPELNDEAALKAVGKLYRAGLENLKKKVEAAK